MHQPITSYLFQVYLIRFFQMFYSRVEQPARLGYTQVTPSSRDFYVSAEDSSDFYCFNLICCPCSCIGLHGPLHHRILHWILGMVSRVFRYLLENPMATLLSIVWLIFAYATGERYVRMWWIVYAQIVYINLKLLWSCHVDTMATLPPFVPNHARRDGTYNYCPDCSWYRDCCSTFCTKLRSDCTALAKPFGKCLRCFRRRLDECIIHVDAFGYESGSDSEVPFVRIDPLTNDVSVEGTDGPIDLQVSDSE